MTLPFVSDTTEYEEFWTGWLHSNLQWVADELLTEEVQADELYWCALLSWVLEYQPKAVKWMVKPAPTPDHWIHYHWSDWVKRLRTTNKIARALWPDPGVPKDWYVEKSVSLEKIKQALGLGFDIPKLFKWPTDDYFNRFCAWTHPHSYVGNGPYTYDAETIHKLRAGDRLKQLEDLVGPLTPLFVSETRPYLPWNVSPDQIEAAEYNDACRKLQASEAGRRAKNLLLDNLNEAQRRDYLLKGFFVVAPSDFDPEARYQKRYAIERDFPNGNIWEMENQRIRGDWCYHPDEPYPVDDILLTQKLMIENEIEALREVGNFTNKERLKEPHVEYIQAAATGGLTGLSV